MRIAWEMEERGERCALGNALRLEAEEVVRRDGGEKKRRKPHPQPLSRGRGEEKRWRNGELPSAQAKTL